MQTKNRTLMIIALITFVIFAAATILIFTSAEYSRASERVKYLHSDLRLFSVEVEQNMGWGKSEYRKWKREVDEAEATLRKYQIPGFICGGLAILSLGSVVVISVQDKKQQKNSNTTNTIAS